MNIEREKARLSRLYDIERELKHKGYNFVAGVDEAGRGPLAGPVVAGVAVLSLDTVIIDLKDSKKISENKRNKVYKEIQKKAVAYAYDEIDVEYIDKHNILNATLLAMRNAIKKLPIKPDFVLVDALKIPEINIPQRPIIHGDNLCACIAAASIVAKVERDRIMSKYDSVFPEYSFIKNKGYGTKEHIDSIKKHGISPIHRRSFSVKGLEV